MNPERRRYHILEADNLDDLADKVNGYMAGMIGDSISGLVDTSGWLPAGGPFETKRIVQKQRRLSRPAGEIAYTSYDDTKRVFCQAIYRP